MAAKRLNLGCGHDKRPRDEGWLNVDADPSFKPALVHDISQGLPFRNAKFEPVELKDVLEHVGYPRVESVLSEVRRVLKRQGTLYVQCPDMEAIAEKVILSGRYDWDRISYWVYGRQSETTQKWLWEAHKSGFTITTLRKLLEAMGFEVLEIRNDGGTNIQCWARRV